MKESSLGNELLPRAVCRSRIGRNALWSNQELSVRLRNHLVLLGCDYEPKKKIQGETDFGMRSQVNCQLSDSENLGLKYLLSC